LLPALGLALAVSVLAPAAHAQGGYLQKNLVSDIPGLADNHDPNLVNPWGISAGPATPFWVSNAGSGNSTLYNTSGTPLPLVVSIPHPGGGPSVPTGQVFNSSSHFNGDRFIFASARGTISGWRGPLGTTAETLVDRSADGAEFLGLAIANVGTNSYLYAADFARNRIEVVGSTGAPALTGNFSDATLPEGYAPFNIQNLGSSLYVTYALRGEDGFDVAGVGNGFVNEFAYDGTLLGRFASNGLLNSPWGLALAPDNFGEFAGNLLVGNFGDGTINAFDANTGDLIGTLKDSQGNPLINEGLWGLQFGNGGAGGTLGTLYFAAGINDEQNGLFGSFTPVPEPSTYALSGLALLGLCVAIRQRRRHQQRRATAPVAA
jgi:uncharacterized protein (TIGR03118 family)